MLQGSLGTLALVAGSPLLAENRGATPAQTEGPFFPDRDQADKDIDMTLIQGHSEHALGEVVEISGQVLAEDGSPVAEALVDVWQANSHGRYAHERDTNPAPLDPNFQGWARFTTDAEGRYRVKTIKPGAYPVSEDWSRPPHIHFKVARRGYRELTTQMYFAGESLNDADRLLQELSVDERRRVVVEFAVTAAEGPPRGQFDLVLRGV
jgi:protocatechuate 3,4-dioxygenase beta subunit